MFRRWIVCNGVSRTTSTSGRFSLSITSAARQTRLCAKPVAIADSVFTLHGAITMPRVRKLPLEIGGGLVVLGVSDVRELLHLGEGVVGLVLDRHARPAGRDQVRLDRQVAQPLEQTNAVDRAGGTGDGDDKRSFIPSV